MNWGFISSSEGIATLPCCKEGAEPKGETFQLSGPSLLHEIWLEGMTERMISRIQAQEMSVLIRACRAKDLSNHGESPK